MVSLNYIVPSTPLLLWWCVDSFTVSYIVRPEYWSGETFLLQGIFPTQVSRIAGRFFTSWATREVQEYWSGLPILCPVDLPDPGIEPGSSALQVEFLPMELPGQPFLMVSVNYSVPSPPLLLWWCVDCFTVSYIVFFSLIKIFPFINLSA